MKFEINKTSNISITAQIEQGIEDKINSGFLKEGEKLPSIRSLCSSLGVSFLTVVKAYDKLESKNIIEKRHGKGCFVTDKNKGFDTTFKPEKWQNKVNNYITRAQFHRYLTEGNRGYRYDFSINCTNNFVLDENYADYLKINDQNNQPSYNTYPPIQGDKMLIDVLCSYFTKENIKVNYKNLLITNGIQQAINLVARALVGKGDIVYMQETTFPAAIDVFRWEGAVIKSLPINSNGIDINELHRTCDIKPPEIVYIIPNFNNPQGTLMSEKNKKELLELAETYNFLIVEDDVWSDFYFTDEKPLSIKSMDKNGHVIYLKGFSKLIGMGYRIGSVVANKQVTDILAAAKSISDLGSPSLTQRSVAAILKSDKFEDEIKKRREILIHKKELILSAVNKYGKNKAEYIEPEGGLCLWLRFNESIDTYELLAKARELGINFLPGNIFYPSNPNNNYLRLSYYHMADNDITDGIQKLFELL